MVSALTPPVIALIALLLALLIFAIGPRSKETVFVASVVFATSFIGLHLVAAVPRIQELSR